MSWGGEVAERMTEGSMLRIGVLGAARITKNALISPARELGGIRVAAIAAREPAKARAYARRNGIAEVHSGYAALLADPEIDAIYNPLPAALHGLWTARAIEAGKHVLCEKPFTANAEEAASVAALAEHALTPDGSPLVVMEAFHYRYHPLMRRLVEIAASGELGTIERIDASFCTILPPGDDIRWDASIGGGSTMDVGCYAIHLVRSVAAAIGSGEPTVSSARAKVARGDIDRYLRADLEFRNGLAASVTSALWSARGPDARARVTGTRGSVSVLNPYVSALPNRFVVSTPSGVRREQFAPRSTYSHQLEAFRDAVRDGAPILTGPADAVANMTVVDAAYRAAGMSPREPLR